MVEPYAGGREILHKGCGGKAFGCFPDVCLCPPPPPAGPIPAPLPNNAMAGDLDGCAQSVLVDGNPVATVDSNISKSTGDEPGDPKSGGQGGVITHGVGGKAYFEMGVDSVHVEGKPVATHLSITVQNAQSKEMPNTPPHVILAKMDFAQGGVASCGEDCKVTTYDPNKCPEDPKTGKKKTPHHIVPKHCLKEYFNDENKDPIPYTPKGAAQSPWSKYNPDKAPCICVSGATKTAAIDGVLLEHGRIHKRIDVAEAVAGMRNNEAQEWTLEEAVDAGTAAVAAVLPGCKTECLKGIVADFHSGGNPELLHEKTRAACPQKKKSPVRQSALELMKNTAKKAGTGTGP